MKRHIVFAFFLAIFCSNLMSNTAKADTLDQVINFYNPKLATIKPVFKCVMDGTYVNTCFVNASATQLQNDIDVQNIVSLIQDIRDKKFQVVIWRVGLTAACTWVEFPEKDLVCGDLAHAVYTAGTDAVNATASVAKDVLQITKGIGGAFDCALGGCDTHGSIDISIDAAETWKRCYIPRLQEGILARSGNSRSWKRLLNSQVVSGHFEDGSLIASCPIMSVLLGDMEAMDAVTAYKKQQHQPMIAKYKEIVETASAEAMLDSASRYHDVQNIWSLRAQTRSVKYFTSLIPLNFAMLGEEQDCLKALSGTEARFLETWAIVGQDSKTYTIVDRYSAANWSSFNPKTWCKSYYIADLQKAIEVRRNPYLLAIKLGCVKVYNDPLHLSCPNIRQTQDANGQSALSYCQKAFKDLEKTRCDISVASVGSQNPNIGLGKARVQTPPQSSPLTTQPQQRTPQGTVAPKPDATVTTDPPAKRTPPRVKIKPVMPTKD